MEQYDETIEDMDAEKPETDDMEGAGADAGSSDNAGEASDGKVEEVEAEVIEDEDDGSENETDSGDGKSATDKTSHTPSEAALAAQLADMKDKYARLQAEWDNFRKRTASERDRERSRANERLVTNLLPVVDDLERAISGSGVSEDDPMLAGVKAVYSKFTEVLSREGLVTIAPEKGDAFDIHNHQAVSKVDDPSMPDESIVEVYQKGYTMGDRNIRPAIVVVSTGGPKREA